MEDTLCGGGGGGADAKGADNDGSEKSSVVCTSSPLPLLLPPPPFWLSGDPMVTDDSLMDVLSMSMLISPLLNELFCCSKDDSEEAADGDKKFFSLAAADRWSSITDWPITCSTSSSSSSSFDLNIYINLIDSAELTSIPSRFIYLVGRFTLCN